MMIYEEKVNQAIVPAETVQEIVADESLQKKILEKVCNSCHTPTK